MSRELVFLYENGHHEAEIRYAFEAIARILGVQPRIAPYAGAAELLSSTSAPTITYGLTEPALGSRTHIHICASDLFSSHYLSRASLPEGPLRWHDGAPAIYCAPRGGGVSVIRSGNSLFTTFDLVASAFFMLTRYEEVVAPQHDTFGRFPSHMSLAYRERFLQLPVVNIYVEILRGWLQELGVRVPQPNRWRGHRMAVALTCDVDALRRYRWRTPPLGSICRAAKATDTARVTSLIHQYFAVNLGRQRDPYDNLDELARYVADHELRLTCFLRTDRKRETAPLPPALRCGSAAAYDAGSPDLSRLWARLDGAGVEIGLHPGYNTFIDQERLARQKAALEVALGRPVRGGRQHFLQWQAPTTWRVYESARLSYDASTAYNTSEGFRCGTCTPFQPFDIHQRRALNLWEVPLALMEWALFYEQGAEGCVRRTSLDMSDAVERATRLVDLVERYGGVFSMLWHNSSLDPLQHDGVVRLYASILGHLENKDALALTCWETAQAERALAEKLQGTVAEVP